MKKYPKEVWQAIENDIALGFTYREAGARKGGPCGTISSHMTEKRKKEGGVKGNKLPKRRCPRCGTVIDSPKMKFCWNCGEDIRSEELLLLENIEELLSIASLLPSSQSERTIHISLKIEDYLKRAAKEKGCL